MYDEFSLYKMLAHIHIANSKYMSKTCAFVLICNNVKRIGYVLYLLIHGLQYLRCKIQHIELHFSDLM